MANFCEYCGNPLGANAKFCPACGAPVGSQMAQAEQAQAESASFAELKTRRQGETDALPAGITRSEEGTLCWEYMLNLWRHPTYIALTAKIIAAVLLVIAFIMVLAGEAATALQMLLIVGGIFAVTLLFVYIVVNLLYGGALHYQFAMTDQKIVHTMEAKQREKSKTVATIALIVGLIEGDSSVTGAALANADVSAISMELPKVGLLKPERRKNRIRIREGIAVNWIYCSEAQFDFVWRHLTAHCPQAKIKG